MISYNNDEKFKQSAIESAKRHVGLDELVKGTYGKMNGHFKGCSVGCDAFDIKKEIVNDSQVHSVTSEYFGWPEWVEHLRDGIFEGMDEENAMQWHLDFKESMPIGLSELDFNKIKAKFLIFVLKTNSKRVAELQIDDELKSKVLGAFDQCLSVQEQVSISGEIDESAAESVASAARSVASAARSAAWSAARSAAESAAWSAARSVESAARSVARSVERSAERSAAESAASAARSAEYKIMADYFLELLKESSLDERRR